MAEILIFQRVADGPSLQSVSFAVEPGALVAFHSPKQEASDGIVRLLLGLRRPESGSVTVLGMDPAALAEPELSRFRQRLAVVFPDGGLVSNLKVFENVLLPGYYHGRQPLPALEERGEELLRRVGYDGALMELPGNLSLYQRRLVGQARAFMMEPELMVYNGVLGGLNEEERGRIIANATAFHQATPGMTSILLTTQPEAVLGLDLSPVIGEKVTVCR